MRTVLERIDDAIIVNAQTGCWEWQRMKDRDGYGLIKVGGQRRGAHRISFEEHVGPIPKGLQIDHLCRVRNCVNPEHLEPVTPGENTRRSPWNSPLQCRRGHARTELNTYITPGGTRACRDCHRRASRVYRKSLKQ